ncbi:MAG: tetratricopeptide repeat protein [Bacteroidota bacterium]
MKYLVENIFGIFIFLIFWIALNGCEYNRNSKSDGQNTNQKDSILGFEHLKLRIDSLERRLALDSLSQENNASLLDTLGTVCVELANCYQNTPDAPVALWKATRAFRASGSFPQAIECAKALTDAYPQHDLAPSALFFNALIFNEDLENIASAEFYLDRLLDEYPTDSLAPQAKAMKGLLGLSDQELLRKIDKGK